MSGMVERLRGLKAGAIENQAAEGRRAGAKWAEDVASYEELERLMSFRARVGNDWDAWFSAGESAALGCGHLLAEAITGEETSCHDSTDEFWDAAIGDSESAMTQRCNDDFVRGFAEGAFEAYAEAKDGD